MLDKKVLIFPSSLIQAESGADIDILRNSVHIIYTYGSTGFPAGP